MQSTFHKVHFSIVDVIFRFQFILPLKLTSLQWTHPITPRKAFLVRHLYTYYLKQHFIVSLGFSSFIYLFFSQFNGIFTFTRKNIRRYFQSIFTSMVDTFHSCKYVQRATKQGQKHGCTHGDILLQMANYLFFYSENQDKPQQQYSLPHRWLTFSRIPNTRQPHESL